MKAANAAGIQDLVDALGGEPGSAEKERLDLKSSAHFFVTRALCAEARRHGTFATQRERDGSLADSWRLRDTLLGGHANSAGMIRLLLFPPQTVLQKRRDHVDQYGIQEAGAVDDGIPDQIGIQGSWRERLNGKCRQKTPWHGRDHGIKAEGQ